MNARLVIAGLLLVAGTVVALAGASPQAALSPTKAAITDPGSLVHVKGMVATVDAPERTFQLTDGQTNLTVVLDHDLPAQVAQGQGLVATGTLVNSQDGPVLQATEIQLGCPSKYEA